VRDAKHAAGDKNVLVHGASIAQRALTAGLLDELEIHLIPVLLGQGRRLFDERGPEHIELERTRIIEGEAGVPHMHYRVQRCPPSPSAQMAQSQLRTARPLV
jgi:dihydrofolate reductase